MLLLLWAVEAALIIGVATKVGREHAESLYMRPFCEQCRSWQAPTRTLACLKLGADDPEDLRAAIAAGNWEPLLGRGRSEDEDQAVRLVGGSCNCGELNVLSIERHTHDSDDYRYETLGRDLLVDERLVSRLCQGNRAAR